MMHDESESTDKMRMDDNIKAGLFPHLQDDLELIEFITEEPDEK